MRSLRLQRGDETHLQAVADLLAQLAELGFPVDLGPEAPPAQQPVVLAYTPPARMNGFQSLLYNQAGAAGVAPLPVGRWELLPELPWAGPLVCHFHWLSNVLQGAETPAEADDRIAAFRDVLHTLRAAGRPVVWTVHNVLPHDTTMPEHEIEVRRAVVEAADAIHVMTMDTAAAVEPYFTLPEAKVFYSPHPSYVRAYPDVVSRAGARMELGLSQEAFVFLLFGALQRYKGVDELMSAYEALTAEDLARPVRLVIAGSPSDEELAGAIRLWAAGRDDVLAEPVKVANEDVQYFYRAADISVAPYRRVLNSGIAMLSLSFRTPVLAPACGWFGEVLGTMGGMSYDPECPDGLVRAMRAALVDDLDSQRRRIDAALPRYSPAAASSDFFSGLLRTLGWSRAA